MSAVTLNEDEPFECIRCGKPFGVRKSIERIASQLAGKHSMFLEGGQADRIKMCEDCRITDQFARDDNPFKLGERPRMRTTDDDLRERELARAKTNEIGRAHVCTPVTNAHLVCRLLLEK